MRLIGECSSGAARVVMVMVSSPTANVVPVSTARRWLAPFAAGAAGALAVVVDAIGGEIELWAGVTTEDYPLFTVTIQDEADPVSSGRVVLRGTVGQ